MLIRKKLLGYSNIQKQQQELDRKRKKWKGNENNNNNNNNNNTSRRGIGVVLIPATDELGVRIPQREVMSLVQTTL